MAMEKLDPILRVSVWPRGSILRMLAPPLGVCDVFAGRLENGQGEASDGPASDSEPSFDSQQWRNQFGFEYIAPSLDFLTFQDDGTAAKGAAGVGSGGTGGFVLKPRGVQHNSVITANPDFDLPSGLPLLQCVSKRGNWSQRLADGPAQTAAIYLQTHNPDKTAEAWTPPIRANEGFVLTIEWVGIAANQKSDPGFRITLPGGRYSLLWRMNRQRGDARPETQRRNPRGEWETWRRLSEAEPVKFTGRSLVSCNIIGGRWVIGLNDKLWHLPDSALTDEDIEAGKQKAAYWSEGPIVFTSFGVQPAIQISKITYSSPDEEPFQGGLKRIVTGMPERANWEAMGSAVRGYHAPGTGASIGASKVPDKRELEYTVSLTASPDGLATPMVTGASVQMPAEWAQEEHEPLDLRPFITSWEYTSAEPGTIGASEFSCQINRTRLVNAYPDWEQRVQQFSPITVELGWRYRHTTLGTDVAGELEPIFDGYLLNPDRDLKEYLGQGLALTARDRILRIQEPAGFVDERFAPLDVLFNINKYGDLYGGQCIKYLLGLQFGAEFSSRINGTGNPLQFFPAGHYPLMSRSSGSGYIGFAQPIADSGPSLPPPYGEALQSWFSTIAGYDYAVLYWGRSPADPTGPPCLIYGRSQLIAKAWEAVQGNKPIVLPDRDYDAHDFEHAEGGDTDGNDADRLVGSAAMQFHAEKAYNDFVAWGSNGEGGEKMKGYSPASQASRGRALLPTSDPNSSDYSWRRTLLLKQDYLDKEPGTAQNLAARTAQEFTGVDIFTGTLFLPRGIETLHWGQTVLPRLETDPTGKLNGQTLRIVKVSHKGSFAADTAPDQKFTTELTVRPLSGTGL